MTEVWDFAGIPENKWHPGYHYCNNLLWEFHHRFIYSFNIKAHPQVIGQPLIESWLGNMQLKPTGNFEFCTVSDYLVHICTDGMKLIFHSLLCFDLQAGIVCHSNVVYITYSYFPVGCCRNKCQIKTKGLHSKYNRCNTWMLEKGSVLWEGFVWQMIDVWAL